MVRLTLTIGIPVNGNNCNGECQFLYGGYCHMDGKSPDKRVNLKLDGKTEDYIRSQQCLDRAYKAKISS